MVFLLVYANRPVFAPWCGETWVEATQLLKIKPRTIYGTKNLGWKKISYLSIDFINQQIEVCYNSYCYYSCYYYYYWWYYSCTDHLQLEPRWRIEITRGKTTEKETTCAVNHTWYLFYPPSSRSSAFNQNLRFADSWLLSGGPKPKYRLRAQPLIKRPNLQGSWMTWRFRGPLGTEEKPLSSYVRWTEPEVLSVQHVPSPWMMVGMQPHASYAAEVGFEWLFS